MKLQDLAIRSFRCHISAEIPGVGAANAIDIKKRGFEAELTPLGVLLKVPLKNSLGEFEHHPTLIPFTNVQAVFFEPPAKEVSLDDQPKRGRPKALQSEAV